MSEPTYEEKYIMIENDDQLWRLQENGWKMPDYIVNYTTGSIIKITKEKRDE